MAEGLRIILIALTVTGSIFLLVGFTLVHHIGGFMKTVEEEAREAEKDDSRPCHDTIVPEQHEKK